MSERKNFWDLINGNDEEEGKEDAGKIYLDDDDEIINGGDDEDDDDDFLSTDEGIQKMMRRVQQKIRELSGGDDDEDEDDDDEDDELRMLMESIEQYRPQKSGDEDDEDDDEDENLGDADDYHNKSCVFARIGNYKRAAAICEAGLKKYPNNVDLVADLVNYHSKSGNFPEVHRYLEIQMQRIPRSLWNWRSFTFAIDALVAENAHENEALLRELTADYQKYLPHEERAYLAEHDVEKALGNDANAIDALEKGIHIHLAAEGCCLRLADYLIERGDFRKSREIAMRGIAASAQSQPGIRTSYCALLVCLCDDALLWLNCAEGKPIEAAEVQRVLKEYEALDRRKEKLIPYRDLMEDRKALLQFLLVSAPQEAPREAAE